MASEPEAGDLGVELRELVASAAALIRELGEEGFAGFTARPPDPLPGRLPEPRSAIRPRTPAAPETRPRAVPPLVPPLVPVVPVVPVVPAVPAVTPAVAPLAAARATPSDTRRATLGSVRAELGDCRRCGLCEGRNTIVFGDGNPDADILFVGEGPGEQEDRTGLPFVGRAGELLTQMIEKGMGIPRRDVYICNIVKCRPPGNRNPLPPEVSACRPFLDGQIEAVAPRVIVALGKPAASLLLDREISITRLRGTWHDYRGIPLMPTLHPAYVLRQYTPENRRAVWQDLQAALARSRT